MSKKVNEKAWEILREDEKASVTLSLGHNKSSWEAGEIMNKAHYKYLEIMARAEKFLRMFTEYFNEHGGLKPKGSNIPVHFEEYLHCVITNRMTIKDTIDHLEDGRYKVTTSRDRVIGEVMKNLLSSKNTGEVDLANLLLEFDRWNNFRVLPKTLQQPSAFKRRNKTRDLKNLKLLLDIPHFSIKKLYEKYGYTGKGKSLYVPIITNYKGGRYITMQIEYTAVNVNHLSRLGLLVFETFEQSENIAELIANYKNPVDLSRESRVMSGQRFWPRFRVQVVKAINYNIVNNLIPSRKYLEDAYTDLDLRQRKNR
jgi:hypothetical protein